jgi:hypothetical protein
MEAEEHSRDRIDVGKGIDIVIEPARENERLLVLCQRGSLSTIHRNLLIFFKIGHFEFSPRHCHDVCHGDGITE